MRAEPLFCTQAEVPLYQHSCPPCPPVGRFPHGRVVKKMISFSAAPDRKIWKKFKPSINRLSKMNSRPAKITQQPAGPPLNCHSSHICGARGVMGGDLQNSRGLIFSLGHITTQQQGRQKACSWGAEISKHALKAIFRYPASQILPESQDRLLPALCSSNATCTDRKAAPLLVLQVCADCTCRARHLNFVISLYMSEVCAKHVHIPSAAVLL